MKWSRSDTARLSSAIRRFNKVKENVTNVSNIYYIPIKRDYQTLKENIYNRRELNRVINSLNRFTEDTVELKELPSGEKLTKWEYDEIKRSSERVLKRLNKELDEVKLKQEQKYIFPTQAKLNLENQIENIKNFKNKKGEELEIFKNRIFYQGKSDYKLMQSIKFRERYVKVLEKYEGYANYDLLMKKIESLKDPESFYRYIKDNDMLVDLSYNSNEEFDQERFNSYVLMWGVDVNELKEVTENPKAMKKQLKKEYKNYKSS